MLNSTERKQGRSQNAERDTHIKGRLLDQAVILFNYAPFKTGTSLKGKNLLQEGANSSVKSNSLWYGNHFYHISWDPLHVTIFITHVRYCVMGATPMIN